MIAPDLGFTHRYLPTDGTAGPTLLLLHGTGGDEQSLLPLGRSLAPGAGLLSPRGKVLEHGMPRFFRRLAEGVFDLQDLTFRTQELAGFIAAAAAAYGFDPSRLIAVGYSNGANIAASLLLLHPEALAGAVLLRPMVPLQPPAPPALTAKPVFIGAGRHDPLVPPAQSEALADLLRRHGAAVTVHWQQGDHGIGREELIAARGWLDGLPTPS